MLIRRKIFRLGTVLFRVLAVSLIMITSAIAQHTDLTIDEAKAHYIIEITKHITWPNDAKIKQFRVGVIGSAPLLMKALERRNTARVRGRGFQFEKVDAANVEVEHYTIIFIAKRYKTLIKEIFSKSKNTLIISDGYVDKEYQMASIISSPRKTRIKINRDNLAKRGFGVSVNLLALVGSKEDLSDHLRDKETQLKQLLSEVEKKKTDLESLNSTLHENTQLLSSTQDRLREQSEILEKTQFALKAVSTEIDRYQNEVAKNKVSLAQQKQLLRIKQSELAENEGNMTRLQAEISKNKTILSRQITEINKQDALIEHKDKTILEQRGWLIFVLFVIVVFVVMIYVLLKINTLRKKTNKELERVNSQLYELATTDGMTKLFNRRHFLEVSQNELLRQARIDTQSVILMLDIDFFKKVNDTHGHAMGDNVICSVATLLKNSLRQYDLVGRLGGEEYAMMLVDCDVALALKIAQRLCNEIAAQEIVDDGKTIKITISVGLSQIDKEDTDVEQSLVRADSALYEAKNAGRNRVVAYSK